MKKINNLTFIALFTFFGLSAFSFNSNDNANESKVKETVVRQIEYPDFAKEQNIQGEVYVSFMVNKNGKITVISSNSTEQKLQHYVVEKIKTVDLSSVEVIEGYTYNVKFSFKLM